jgi:hypothetical protein
MSTDATDDGVIENMAEQASRAIDLFTGKWFYGYTQTRYFDVPRSRELKLDQYLLAITTLTNGDGAAIANTEYDLLPKNEPPYYIVRLKKVSSISWQYSTTTDDELAISLAGLWGFVDRAATDPVSVRYVRATEEACILTVMNEYHRLSGENTSGTAIVTAAGVVITPASIPQKAIDILGILMKKF